MTSDDRSSGFSLSGFGGSAGVEITDDESGGIIGGGSGSNSSRKSWTNARRYETLGFKWPEIINKPCSQPLEIKAWILEKQFHKYLVHPKCLLVYL